MQEALLHQLRAISQEEKEILSGKGAVEKSIYTTEQQFVINARQMLNKGKLMDVRTHTRFVHFPKHSHDYIEIIYMCQGQTTHIINEENTVVLKEGDLLFLGKNTSHEILPAAEEDIAVNFIVLPEFFNRTFELLQDENAIRDFLVGSLQQNGQVDDYIYFHVADLLPVQNLIENMIWSLLHKQPNVRSINQTTMGLLILQLSNYTERMEASKPKQEQQEFVYTILRYIEEHYKDGTLTELAELTNQSVTGLSRQIKKECGKNFKELLQQKRLNQAAFLLSTTKLSVEEIIAAIGYDNTSYFHRIFMERFGMTPRRYRQERRIG